MKTLKQLAQEALDVQDACNLCGVAQGFARVMIELGWFTGSTTERNNHPVARLWSDKIAHLSGTQSYGHEAVTEAYKWCHAAVA